MKPMFFNENGKTKQIKLIIWTPLQTELIEGAYATKY